MQHITEQKVGENTRLSATVKRLRQETARLNKRWKTVVKEIQHIVENTPVCVYVWKTLGDISDVLIDMCMRVLFSI